MNCFHPPLLPSNSPFKSGLVIFQANSSAPVNGSLGQLSKFPQFPVPVAMNLNVLFLAAFPLSYLTDCTPTLSTPSRCLRLKSHVTSPRMSSLTSPGRISSFLLSAPIALCTPHNQPSYHLFKLLPYLLNDCTITCSLLSAYQLKKKLGLILDNIIHESVCLKLNRLKNTNTKTRYVLLGLKVTKRKSDLVSK